MATTMENITKELTAKIAPYNMLVNLRGRRSREWMDHGDQKRTRPKPDQQSIEQKLYIHGSDPAILNKTLISLKPWTLKTDVINWSLWK